MVEPFAFGDYWWKRMIETPYMNGDARAEDVLYDVLRGLMWRNSRAIWSINSMCRRKVNSSRGFDRTRWRHTGIRNSTRFVRPPQTPR